MNKLIFTLAMVQSVALAQNDDEIIPDALMFEDEGAELLQDLLQPQSYQDVDQQDYRSSDLYPRNYFSSTTYQY